MNLHADRRQMDGIVHGLMLWDGAMEGLND